MGNTVISIGSLFRPGNLGEMTEATRDRDYNNKSKISTVIHWTLNEPSQMYNSFSSGVNGIVTDKPDLLKSLVWQSISQCQQKSKHLSSYEKISSSGLEIRIEEFQKTSTGKIKRRFYIPS